MKRQAALLLSLAVAAAFILFLVPKMLHVYTLETRQKNLEAELRRLQLQDQRLENELRLLRSDPVYLEKVARDKLNKAKEGEIVYKVVREGEISASERSQAPGPR